MEYNVTAAEQQNFDNLQADRQAMITTLQTQILALQTGSIGADAPKIADALLGLSQFALIGLTSHLDARHSLADYINQGQQVLDETARLLGGVVRS